MATSSTKWNQRTRDNVGRIISSAAPIRWVEALDEHKPLATPH
jgi:hypothetical protein